MSKEDTDSEGKKIWSGIDIHGNVIWKTEEQLEQEAIKLQKWQRAKFARELGFDPDTKNPLEIADIDMKYEDMLRGLTLYNKQQQRRNDKIAAARLKWEKGIITQEEYDRISDGYD
jgi:hypothetical protein